MPVYKKTMTDLELEGVEAKKGPSHEARAKSFPVGAHVAARDQDKALESIPWGLLTLTHPDYDAPYWEECRALYSGGKTLLRNPSLMERVFPSHNAEDPQIYKERVKRAHYFPYPGAIIDSIAAGLGADPVEVLPSDQDDKEAKLSEWYQEFLKDVTKPGADRCSIHHMAVNQVREAMITGGVSWMLVDLPAAPAEENAPRDRLEQSQRGLLDPYITPIPAENVIEWQATEGKLDYIVVCDTEMRRDSILQPRGFVTKTFTIWTRALWQRYAITYDPKKPPKDDTPVPLVGEGKHKFKVVPVVRLELSEGLRAMDKLESMAREHLNKRNALSWAEYKSLFALLYEFLAPEEGTSTNPTSAAQQDEDRALSVKGQGYVNERGADDSAAFVGPDTAPFAEARDSCDQIKHEMYRVMHAMADSVEQDAGAARRSGESKAQDNAQKDVLLRELGRIARELVTSIMELIQVVKGDEDFRVGGGDSFDSVDLMSKVTEAVELVNGLPMKSPTFLRIYLERIYTLVLKGEVTEKEKAKIREELINMITLEDLMMSDGALPAPPPRPGAKDDGEGEDDDKNRPKSLPLKGGVNYKG